MFKKIALVVAIILVVIVAIFLIGHFSDSNTFPAVLALLLILVIGVFSLIKKKKWIVSNK